MNYLIVAKSINDIKQVFCAMIYSEYSIFEVKVNQQSGPGDLKRQILYGNGRINMLYLKLWKQYLGGYENGKSV